MVTDKKICHLHIVRSFGHLPRLGFGARGTGLPPSGTAPAVRARIGQQLGRKSDLPELEQTLFGGAFAPENLADVLHGDAEAGGEVGLGQVVFPQPGKGARLTARFGRGKG